MITICTFLEVLFKHIVIILTSFIDLPNSVRMLYDTSLLTES
jgi:hypothetical protein